MTQHSRSDLSHSSHPFAKTLRTIHETFVVSGSQYTLEEFSDALTKQLHASPDREMALTGLLRFVEATVSKASLFNDLLHYPVLFEVLMKVFGYSRYFVDILVRDPELFRWLTASDSLVKARTREAIESEVRRIDQMFQKPERKLDALKRLYRREVLRVGVRDILADATLATITEELSILADCLIDAACRVAEQQLSSRFPVAPKTPYAVIGLGKLGGSELNYSSDVDIMFVYGKEGNLKLARGSATYHEYFNLLVEKMVQNLSQPSAEGHLYRVDTRLRPEGGVGPLARSVRSFLTHYESRGELWERQMLIKARPVAGDVEFGWKFLRQLEPFVYPRTLFQHPAEYIARTKARIELAIGDEDNVKLRAGGIRDVEFIVQTLQLLHGGRSKTVRECNTLRALEVLEDQSLLSPEEAELLREAYIFLRTLEHRLQIMLNTQTHTLPGDHRTMDTLAKRMGGASASELREGVSAHSRAVRKVFDAVLSTGEAKTDEGLAAIVDGNVEEETVTKALVGFGFRDCRRAAKNLSSLALGKLLLGAREPDARARTALRRIVDLLFKEIAATASPDMTLQNLTLLLGGQKWADQFYTQLGEGEFRKFVLSVCGISPRFAKELARSPQLFESLTTDVRSLFANRRLTRPPWVSLARLKHEEELRAGVRNVLGLSSFDELAEDLSRLSDFVVTETHQEVCGRYRKEVPLAVIAVGKYGTREINFDADLDLVFVAESDSKLTLNKLEDMAAAIVNRLSSVSEEGKLYEVDARLRPEGKNAPLVVERTAYKKYLHERASLWERQSLTRARFVCGDNRVGKKTLDDVAKFVYHTPLTSSWIQATVAMRKKMESRSRTQQAGYHDIKLGAGGMVDVEFLVQMFQLRFGGEGKELRSQPTRTLLQLMTPGILSASERDSFAEAYALYRELEKLMRITLEEPGSLLPEGEKLELLARVAGTNSAEALRTRVATTMKHTRKQFLQITDRMSQVQDQKDA